MRSTANMGSDFELRTTLSEIHDEELPTGEQFVALLGAGATLGSDFEARTLLEHVGPRMPSTPEAVTAYLNLADTIGSDFELRLALTPIVTNVELGDELVSSRHRHRQRADRLGLRTCSRCSARPLHAWGDPKRSRAPIRPRLARSAATSSCAAR